MDNTADIKPGAQLYALLRVMNNNSNNNKYDNAVPTTHFNFHQQGESFAQVIISPVVQEAEELEKHKNTKFLLDTASMFSCINNPSMVNNIRRASCTLRGYTNSGYRNYLYKANMPGWFKVWYNPELMVNILALCNVAKHFRITADTAVEDAISVHISKNKFLKFTA